MRIEKFLDQLATRALTELTGEASPALLKPTADPRHGDFQVNAAMALAKKLGKKPREIAEPLADRLARNEAIEHAEVAGPGFVNITLSSAFLARVLDEAAADSAHDGIDRTEVVERIVVDFSSLLYRAFFSMPETLPAHAVHGVLNMLARVVADRHPRGLAIAVDEDWRPAFRVEAIPSYKTHRLEEADEADGEEESAVEPIEALWGLAPAAMVEPITLVFRVNRDGKVTEIFNPLSETNDLVRSAVRALGAYRFEPLLGDGPPTQGGTFIVRAEGAGP